MSEGFTGQHHAVDEEVVDGAQDSGDPTERKTILRRKTRLVSRRVDDITTTALPR